jgi:NAD(P)-dependent dehydrogenase (short-subunit alcohol dehydrogenase family)
MTATGLLQDAVVLISGGTQGVGAGIARLAAVEGAADIAVTGRSVEAGKKAAQGITDLGVPAIFLEADLADTKQPSSTVARTIERFGRLDAVVNAAGLTTRGSMTDTSPSCSTSILP